MVCIGLDPGGSGGVAVIRPGEVCTYAMPGTDRDVFDLLEGMVNGADGRFPSFGFGVHACLERVHGIPKWGASNFAFGTSYGALRMALTAARIPFDEVQPKAWQQVLGVTYRKGMTGTEKKNLTKRRAQSLFPQLTITHATADALLIAEYCRRLHGVKNGEEVEGE